MVAEVHQQFEHSPLPVSVKSFYDPNGYFMQQDPETADSRLLDFVIDKRREPVLVQNVGQLATSQLVVSELRHARLITLEDSATIDWLDTTTDEIEQTITAVDAAADRTALQSIAASRLIRDDFPATKKTPDTVLAGAILAAKAHETERRLNDKPYYYHPQAVAIMLGAAWDRHFGEIDGLDIQLHQFRAFLHDAFENAFPKNQRSFMTHRQPIVSPLVADFTLAHLEVPRCSIDEVCDDLLALTKTVGPDRSHDYAPYIQVLRRRMGAIPSKLGDIHDNRDLAPKIAPVDDPVKARKIFAKVEEYNDAEFELKQGMNNVDPTQVFKLILFAELIMKLTAENLVSATNRSPISKIQPAKLVEAFDTALAA